MIILAYLLDESRLKTIFRLNHKIYREATNVSARDILFPIILRSRYETYRTVF